MVQKLSQSTLLQLVKVDFQWFDVRGGLHGLFHVRDGLHGLFHIRGWVRLTIMNRIPKKRPKTSWQLCHFSVMFLTENQLFRFTGYCVCRRPPQQSMIRWLDGPIPWFDVGWLAGWLGFIPSWLLFIDLHRFLRLSWDFIDFHAFQGPEIRGLWRPLPSESCPLRDHYSIPAGCY